MIIKKSLIVSVVLISMYSMIIMLLEPEYNTAQNDLQSNIINAQKYLYSKNTTKNVIVGTSLSTNISLDPKYDTYNLSFAGGGIFDGLNILSKKSEIPDRIFIETNYIERQINPVIKDVLDNKESQIIKQLLPITREENQPVGLLIGKMYSLLFKAQSEKKRNQQMIEELVSSEVLKNNSTELSEGLMTNIELLKSHINKYKSHGTTIVFYEMPTHPKICNAPYPEAKREQLYKVFPKDRFFYINQPSCSEIITSDGRHLTKEELVNYKNYFVRSIQPLYEND